MLWPQAVHTDVHILNRCLLRNNHSETPYQLWKGRPASVKHFRIFGSKCYIKRVDKHLGKLDSRTDEGILVLGFGPKRSLFLATAHFWCEACKAELRVKIVLGA